MNELFKKQNELYKKQHELSKVACSDGDYETMRKVQKQQDEYYQKYLFYKKFNEVRRKNN